MFNFETLETHLCFNFYAHTNFIPQFSEFCFEIPGISNKFFFENKREFKLAIDYLIDNRVNFEVVYVS